MRVTHRRDDIPFDIADLYLFEGLIKLNRSDVAVPE